MIFKTTKTQRAQRFFVSFVSLWFLLSIYGLAAGSAVKGDDLYTQGRYQEAVVEYQSELKSEPDSARLRTNLGCAFYHLGRYNEAMRELRTARDLKPEPAQAARIHYNIGNCYFTTD